MTEVFTARPKQNIIVDGFLFCSKIKYIVSVEVRDPIYIKGNVPISMPDYSRHKKAICRVWGKDLTLSSDDFIFE